MIIAFENIIEYLGNEFLKVIISNKKRKESDYNKIVVQFIENGQKVFYQFSFYTKTQVFHKNIFDKDEVVKQIIELFKDFKQLDIFDKDTCVEIKETKKGKLFVNKSLLKSQIKGQTEHNLQKAYLLSPEMKIPALIDLGVITTDGKIIQKSQAKFRQINKFLEIIVSEIKDISKDEIRILDFGCGKSYLTFIIYYYLKFILKKDVHIIGLDLKKDVIEHCNKISQKYGYENLQFVNKDIKDFSSEDNFDVMVSLHACDTATDYALFNAFRLGIKYIFSVPCCQHEIFHQINDNLNFITKYSILKERFSSIFTDAFRGNILEATGYKVQMCEFIDFDASPKNILIKAVKQNNKIDKIKLEQIENLLKQYDCKQTLFNCVKTYLKF